MPTSRSGILHAGQLCFNVDQFQQLGLCRGDQVQFIIGDCQQEAKTVVVFESAHLSQQKLASLLPFLGVDNSDRDRFHISGR